METNNRMMCSRQPRQQRRISINNGDVDLSPRHYYYRRRPQRGQYSTTSNHHPFLSLKSLLFVYLFVILLSKQQLSNAYHIGEVMDVSVMIKNSKNNYNRQQQQIVHLRLDQKPKFGLFSSGPLFDEDLIRFSTGVTNQGNDNVISITKDSTIAVTFQDHFWILPMVPIMIPEDHRREPHPQILVSLEIPIIYTKRYGGTIVTIMDAEPTYHYITTHTSIDDYILEQSSSSSRHDNYYNTQISYRWIEEGTLAERNIMMNHNNSMMRRAPSLLPGQTMMYLMVFLVSLYFMVVSCRCMDDDTNNNEVDTNTRDIYYSYDPTMATRPTMTTDGSYYGQQSPQPSSYNYYAPSSNVPKYE